MTDLVKRYIIPAALSVLPDQMNTPMAHRMLAATGWQESRLRARKQVGGPARGLWQFEAMGGVRGVLEHTSTKTHARTLLVRLGYSALLTPHEVWALLEHNDILAAGFARLLLWTLPDELPRTAKDGWEQYRAAWRPGKPHPATWSEAWTVGAPECPKE